LTTILITGAGRGIGFELARQSIEKKWNVIGSVRSVAAQRVLAEKLPQIAVLNFDVTDHEAVEKVANAFHSPIDILVNCAGVVSPERQSTLDMDFDGFARTLEVNVLAPLKISQVFLPLIKQSNNGRIVNISSQMGRMTLPGSDRIAYRASKAALNKVTQGLATDLLPQGVTVVAMHPGWVSTDMGGPTAPVTPADSAAGMLRVIENLDIKDTGRFIDWDGTPQSW